MIVVVSGMNALVRRSCVRVPCQETSQSLCPLHPFYSAPAPALRLRLLPPLLPSPCSSSYTHFSTQCRAHAKHSILHESLNASERPHIPLPAPNPPLSSYALAPEKLRALIDLYHSSTGYITPETLSSAIDKTDLVAERDELDAEPDRVVPSANELSGRGHGTVDGIAGPLAGGWSESKAERARMVKAALWGVDPMAKIGLETLLEAKVELEAQDKERKE
ncbi:hypothetical protein RHS01_00727 [Rhizoctonia solani]|uniref:Uncharacterized protein n=1 Tax=Rhizoctonia solani TaxID=456999 RepID=A0A8H7IMX0_9AGAM|nr:hypothetical protein RHS01_00727 [Rhizoctonia solani]